MDIEGRLKKSPTPVTLDSIGILTFTHISCIKPLHRCFQEQCFIFEKVFVILHLENRVPYKFTYCLSKTAFSIKCFLAMQVRFGFTQINFREENLVTVICIRAVRLKNFPPEVFSHNSKLYFIQQSTKGSCVKNQIWYLYFSFQTYWLVQRKHT